jgi:hypothetical protein
MAISEWNITNNDKMNRAFRFFIAICLFFTACAVLKPVRRLIDQKNKYVWTGNDGTERYLLTIDRAEGIEFAGRIICSSRDTLYIRGFEKGSVHNTAVKLSPFDTINTPLLGHIFLNTRGYTADTVLLKNNRDSISQLPIRLLLIKRHK